MTYFRAVKETPPSDSASLDAYTVLARKLVQRVPKTKLTDALLRAYVTMLHPQLARAYHLTRFHGERSYAVFGLKQGDVVLAEAVQRTYRRLVLMCAPDKYPEPATLDDAPIACLLTLGHVADKGALWRVVVQEATENMSALNVIKRNLDSQVGDNLRCNEVFSDDDSGDQSGPGAANDSDDSDSSNDSDSSDASGDPSDEGDGETLGSQDSSDTAESSAESVMVDDEFTPGAVPGGRTRGRARGGTRGGRGGARGRGRGAAAAASGHENDDGPREPREPRGTRGGRGRGRARGSAATADAGDASGGRGRGRKRPAPAQAGGSAKRSRTEEPWPEPNEDAPPCPPSRIQRVEVRVSLPNLWAGCEIHALIRIRPTPKDVERSNWMSVGIPPRTAPGSVFTFPGMGRVLPMAGNEYEDVEVTVRLDTTMAIHGFDIKDGNSLIIRSVITLQDFLLGNSHFRIVLPDSTSFVREISPGTEPIVLPKKGFVTHPSGATGDMEITRVLPRVDINPYVTRAMRVALQLAGRASNMAEVEVMLRHFQRCDQELERLRAAPSRSATRKADADADGAEHGSEADSLDAVMHNLDDEAERRLDALMKEVRDLHGYEPDAAIDEPDAAIDELDAPIDEPDAPIDEPDAAGADAFDAAGYGYDGCGLDTAMDVMADGF